ncbi:Oidioi.mRNA.OKI2018_I69.XSR.g16547.t2.cds [Oikopleura dioica]|uniref:Oidioi.mRNA.OKI2018_I69.XSR.g16547.t2.cds n=1 Tax=Oikopleura dioica TaxID=34765 RepID=A0ABN7SQT8_OIKDI|nr:Oidioi.mRNA.OKI2018_I69.XSR.g16547.t2.cds [Oikopleura dioica]
MCLAEGRQGIPPCNCHLRGCNIVSEYLSPEEEDELFEKAEKMNRKIDESIRLRENAEKKKGESDDDDSDDPKGSTVKLRREVDLIGAIFVIIGSQIGSGIFVSPKGVLRLTGSAGFSLISWMLAGVVATIGALCYAEVGTLVNESGGEYPILYKGYKGGKWPAFMFAWTCSTILKPSSFAILSLTCAKYTLSSIESIMGYNLCGELSPYAEKFFAMSIIWLVVAINCASVKLTNQILKIFGYGKVISIGIIIIAGLVLTFMGQTIKETFAPATAFVNYETNEVAMPSIGAVGLSLYQGLWAYDGWNQLNYISEEVVNPGKNLPRAIIIAMSSVTILYLFTNYAYLSVLGVNGLLDASAVGTAFASRVTFLPGLDKIIPVMVMASVFGTCLISCFTAARVPYCAARKGQYPHVLSMIHVKRMTPVPAVMFNGIIATLMIWPNDFDSLVNYFSFCMWIFHTSACFATITLRKRMPIEQHPRLFKVPIAFPYIISVIGTFLILVPFFDGFDWGFMIALGWILLGVVLYSVLGNKKDQNASGGKFAEVTKLIQIALQVVPEE